jgi:hypothetical protein
MLEFDEEIIDVAWHADETAPVHVVPFDVDSCKLVPRHVELHSVVFFEEILQVVEVFKADVLHPKVVQK